MRKTDYPIFYHWSFVLFWGVALSLEGFVIGGILPFAYTLLCMLVVVSHEHAHAAKCIELGIPIHSIEFYWLGGGVITELDYASDIVDFLEAGVKDTAYYSIGFITLFIALLLFGRDLVNGYLFILYPFRDLVGSIAFFATALAIANCLPYSYKTNIILNGVNHSILVSTDGWAAWKYRELRDELWNDGKSEAMRLYITRANT
jgi:hypothetical protein